MWEWLCRIYSTLNAHPEQNLNIVLAVLVSASAGALGGLATTLLLGSSAAAIGAGASAGIAAAVMFGRIYRSKPSSLGCLGAA